MAALPRVVPQPRGLATDGSVIPSPSVSFPASSSSSSSSRTDTLTSLSNIVSSSAYSPSPPSSTTGASSTSFPSALPSSTSSSFSSTSSRTTSSISGVRTSVPIVFSVPLTESVTIPQTITLSSSLLVSDTVILSLLQEPTTSYSIVYAAPTSRGNIARTVCAGNGLDSMSIGVLSTIIFSAAVGAVVWVCLVPFMFSAVTVAYRIA